MIANIWQSPAIIVIRPDGRAVATIDGTPLVDEIGSTAPSREVLNGIAVRDETSFWLTGKQWPTLFAIGRTRCLVSTPSTPPLPDRSRHRDRHHDRWAQPSSVVGARRRHLGRRYRGGSRRARRTVRARGDRPPPRIDRGRGARHLERLGVRSSLHCDVLGSRPSLGLITRHDPTIAGRHDPLPGEPGRVRGRWYRLGHLDGFQAYRADVGQNLPISCGLKSLAKFVGLEPVEVDRRRIHELTPEEMHEYVLSDARLARQLLSDGPTDLLGSIRIRRRAADSQPRRDAGYRGRSSPRGHRRTCRDSSALRRAPQTRSVSSSRSCTSTRHRTSGWPACSPHRSTDRSAKRVRKSQGGDPIVQRNVLEIGAEHEVRSGWSRSSRHTNASRSPLAEMLSSKRSALAREISNATSPHCSRSSTGQRPGSAFRSCSR